MALYFLDTSAIVRRYIPKEQGHIWISDMCSATQNHRLYIAQTALVEVVSAICRRGHEKRITNSIRDQLVAQFRVDTQNDYKVWRVTASIFDFAGDLCKSYRLRAYDAVQLACALQLRDKIRAFEDSPPIFVCADNALLEFASDEGLVVENPNNYS